MADIDLLLGEQQKRLQLMKPQIQLNPSLIADEDAMNALKYQRGFNLVEMMVSVAIMCILMVIATPTYSGWMSNQRTRSVAEGINMGIQQARSEAIRRNASVTFKLSADTSWSVRDSTAVTLNQKTATESSKSIALVKTPVAATTLTFNGYGQLTANADATSPMTQIDVSSNNTYAGKKGLRVMIGAGGASLVCDPSVTDNQDTRFCRSV